jgi:uncharacterized membrane protein
MVRIRLFGSVALGVVVYLLTPEWLGHPTRMLIGWNVAIAVFLVLAGVMMARSTHESMRRRARDLDEGRHAVLVLSVVAALSSLTAIVFELFHLKSASTGVAGLHIGLSIATILTSWSFVHMIFTEHYAHGYYIKADDEGDGAEESRDEEEEDSPRRRGLHFPGQQRPDYVDFLYFSFTIGVANQTADVEIDTRATRLLVLIHSVLSYFFNTIILALTINIAAGLLGG